MRSRFCIAIGLVRVADDLAVKIPQDESARLAPDDVIRAEGDLAAAVYGIGDEPRHAEPANRSMKMLNDLDAA